MESILFHPKYTTRTSIWNVLSLFTWRNYTTHKNNPTHNVPYKEGRIIFKQESIDTSSYNSILQKNSTNFYISKQDEQAILQYIAWTRLSYNLNYMLYFNKLKKNSNFSDGKCHEKTLSYLYHNKPHTNLWSLINTPMLTDNI